MLIELGLRMLDEILGKDDNRISFLVCEKEYESPELNDLVNWFVENDFTLKEEDWGVVGSQEITICRATRGEIQATLLFETYQGVTLHTDKENADVFSDIKKHT